MSIVTDEKVSGNAKAEETKNKLGISRTIYAVGYSLKDALVWGLAATIAIFGVITLGSKKFPAIKKFEDTLIRMHNWWKELTGERLKGGVVGVSIIAGWMVGHLAQIPSGAVGWKKAQKAIDKHNKLHAEKDQLVETNTVLMEDNEKLKAALARAEKDRLPLADRVRANPAEAAAGNSI